VIEQHDLRQVIKNWKRRYFVLSGKHLTYHKDVTAMTTEPPLGLIYLKAVEVGEETGQV
jgi:hypothetical protein